MQSSNPIQPACLQPQAPVRHRCLPRIWLLGLFVAIGFAQAQPEAPGEPVGDDAEPPLPMDGEIFDLQPPKPTPRFTPAEWTLIGTGGALGLGLLTALLFFTLRGRKKEVEAPSAYVLAREDLRRAQQFKSVDQVNRFSVELSHAVRTYVERAFQVPAPELTTEEFLPKIQRHPVFQGELSSLLRDFLKMCDLAKFARQQFDQEGLDQIQSLAEAIVDKAHLQQTEDREAVPQPSPASGERDTAPPEKEVAGS